MSGLGEGSAHELGAGSPLVLFMGAEAVLLAFACTLELLGSF